MQAQEKMERVVVMLSESDVAELDRVASEEGTSRSGFIRILVKRYLRERSEAEG